MPYNSPEAKLFTDIQTYLAAQMPEIKMVDHNFDQINSPQRPAIASTITLLMDFIEINYVEQQFSQWANIRIRFTVLLPKWNNTASFTDDARKQDALQFYEVTQKLHTKLQGWTNSGMLNLPFNRVRSASVLVEKQGLTAREIEYTCQYEDASVGGA